MRGFKKAPNKAIGMAGLSFVFIFSLFLAVTPARANPDPVTGFTVEPGATPGSVHLEWENPTDMTDVEGVLILYKKDSAPTNGPTDGQDYQMGFDTIGGASLWWIEAPDEYADIGTITPLDQNAEYYFEAYVKDSASTYSPAAQEQTIPKNIFPPGEIDNFQAGATPTDGEVELEWTNPADNDFNGVIIVYKPDGSEPTDPPVHGTEYREDDEITAGGAVVGAVTTGNQTTTVISGLTGGLNYTFKGYARDLSDNYADPKTASATPSGQAGGILPINSVDTEARDAEVRFTWNNPSPLPTDFDGVMILYREDGSEPVDAPVDGTAYTVGATIGQSKVGAITSGTATSAAISGLTNGRAYRFYLYAKDGNDSYASPRVVSETPEQGGVTPPPPPQNNGVLRFDAQRYEIDEGAGTFTITVRRHSGTDNGVGVDYSTEGQSADADDYTPTSGTLYFSHGQSSQDFTIPITDDSVDEGDETLTLRLSNAQGGASLGDPKTAVLTILDNDDPPKLGKLYFPHIASGAGSWETEIALINLDPVQTVDGKLFAYSKTGTEISQTPISLAAKGRQAITMGDAFDAPETIGNLYFEGDQEGWIGYTKFYIDGEYRVAIPAASEINQGDIYISHIASDRLWWTGISLNNTTAQAKTLSIAFDNGQTREVLLGPYANQTFVIADFFDGQTPENVGSAVIKNGDGIVGLEVFGSQAGTGNHYLSGILLKDDTATALYYPHVVSSDHWWTGIVAYNPADTGTALTVIPFAEDGTRLTPENTVNLDPHERYVGLIKELGLPSGTAWIKIEAQTPITGFELFGTHDGWQLGGYSGVGIAKKQGYFAKMEKAGWTGIAFVNAEDQAATVTLTAYSDFGNAIASQTLQLDPYQKVVQYAEALFDDDIAEASYIGFSSDTQLVGFQLNGSEDGILLDGLPGM